MRKWISILAVLMFLLPSALLAVPSASATPYIIHGQVAWGPDARIPISGAVVTITNVDRDPAVYTMSATTDSNGLYSLSPGFNEPGDFANESQTINITVTYTTSKGEVIHAYAEPIVVGSPEETSAHFNQEINFSLTPVSDNSSDSYTLPFVLLLILVILAAILIIYRKKLDCGEKFLSYLF